MPRSGLKPGPEGVPRSPLQGDRESDVKWVERCLAGDRDAFDLLVRREFPRLYALLFRLTGNHEDAEDMTQESFIKAYQSLAYYRGEASFFTWIARIGIHLAHDRSRRAGRELPQLDFEDLDKAAISGLENLPEQAASRQELALALAEGLRRLPKSLHTATVLRLLEGRDYQEVAQLTGLRSGTVRKQVMRSRKLLLEWLAPWLKRSPRP